jgi:D-glycero-alpha-D-manno-heptose-7-phosphate kinase
MAELTITQTPLRISFFGGGTDLKEYYSRYTGSVLSFTINKYIHVIVKPRWDGELVLHHSTRETVRRVDEVQHGLIRECLKATGIEGGLEIACLSDVPTEGSGLGSSSALTVGLLNALHAYKGERRSPRDLAEQACHIEIEVLKEPIGKQDQYAVAVGGCNEYRFHRDGHVQLRPVDMPLEHARALAEHAVLFYTGRTRRAAGILQEQKSQIDRNATHLHALKELVVHGRRALELGRIGELGELLHAGWQQKKLLSSKVHDGEIDRMYDLAREAGAYGGKILGAGGGGFFLFLCPERLRGALRTALADYLEMPFAFEPRGSQIIFQLPNAATTDRSDIR